MCYNAYGSYGTIHVAKQNITCYKFVHLNTRRPTNLDGQIVLAPPYGYNRFKYRFGVIEKIEPVKNIFLTHANSGKVPGTITGGAFHSKIEINNTCDIDLGQYDYGWSRFTLVVKCTIPRGSKYCMNDEEYISDQLRIDYISLDPKHWHDTLSLSEFKHFLTQHKDKFTIIK